MRKLLVTLLLVVFSLVCFAQADLKQLINDGIVLHDKGDFDGAIVKYDEVLQADPSNFQAMFEKSYSLMELKKYDEAAELVKRVIKDCKEDEYRKLSYINYGTIMDYKEDKKKAVKIYDQGIKEFPEFYLLHFNKGITLSGMGEMEESIASFEQSVMLNPFHASSHNALGRLMYAKNRIPAILSFYTFLLIENKSERAFQNFEFLDKLFMKGVERKDDKNVVLTIDPSMLDKKNKKKDDDFSMAEFMLTLLGADNTIADSIGLKTPADKLGFKFQMLINSIDEKEKKEKGFYKNFYVPFFVEMKKNDWVNTASNIIYSASDDEDSKKWLAENKDKVSEFYTWMKNYSWKNK